MRPRKAVAIGRGEGPLGVKPSDGVHVVLTQPIPLAGDARRAHEYTCRVHIDGQELVRTVMHERVVVVVAVVSVAAVLVVVNASRGFAVRVVVDGDESISAAARVLVPEAGGMPHLVLDDAGIEA